MELPPVGSAADGNISPLQMDHAATAVTMPAKPAALLVGTKHMTH